ALVNKGVTLAIMNRPEDAIAVYDEVMWRFGESEIKALSEAAAMAMSNKADILLKTGSLERALAAYESSQGLWPGGPLAIYGRFSTLRKMNKENEAFSYLNEILEPSSLPETTGITLSTLLIKDFAQDNVRLRRVAEAYKNCDKIGSLVGGLVGWIRQLLPMSESDTRDLEKAEETLMEVFAEISQAKSALDMLAAARKDALGDTKALLDLPLELRRLIQREKGEEPDN
ncbi:unnamed protein product, partial [marine sediment metagenome]